MTIQTKQVLKVARDLGHATNLEILQETQKAIPGISATTVHRITTRLINAGMLSKGPDIGGSMIIDANSSVHDHFVCKECVGIKDIKLDETARKEIKLQVPGLKLESSLTITGSCKYCNNH